MEKPISRTNHGSSDGTYVPVVASAPALSGFEDGPGAAAPAKVPAGAVVDEAKAAVAEAASGLKSGFGG